MSRNIFGWSYPPGVTESMLPGNSKEEQEKEAMVESLYEAISPLRNYYECEAGDAEVTEDSVVAALEKIVSDAYSKGKDDARVDDAMAKEYEVPPLNVHIMLGIVTEYLEVAIESMPSGIPCTGEEIDVYADTKEQFTVWAANARELLKHNNELRERSERRRAHTGTCVGCGKPDYECECEVHDFENK